MGMCADQRAVGMTALDSNGQMKLLDRDMRVLATATCYGEWWGICSHRSGISIDRRAASFEEARRILMTTVWLYKPGTARDEYASYDESAKAGSLYIRSLTDQELLEAARDDTCPAYRMIAEWMGPDTNPAWITHECAERAYIRGVMDAEEMDRICR